MSGRRVNFRESPPSSAVSSRYTSDSGHGSTTDTPSSHQWTDLPSLQNYCRTLLAEREGWKKQVNELEDKLAEAEAKWRAVVEANDKLEGEKKTLSKENEENKKYIDKLEDTIHDLNMQLADSNARLNEMQHNPAYATPGTSPHHLSDHLGHADAKSVSSSSRHAKEGKTSSSSSKSSSNAGSGTSSGGSSHNSSRAKVGSSSSTSTAKVSRSSSSRHNGSDHQSAKDQKARLSQRFDPKDDGLVGSNASASSAASSSSQKHHKSGSSGNGSSGSNGSSTSAESGGMRPPLRTRRGSYVEGYGPGPSSLAAAGLSTSQRSPISPNKGVPRSAQAPSVMTVAGGPPHGGYYTHTGYAAPPPVHPYAGPPTSSSGLMSPRGEMDKDGMRPTVHLLNEMTLDPAQDPNYYNAYPSARDPRYDPRLSRR
ncbi:uncharacterized protein SPSK_00287 [Sporothrix schenckii 1099-18]|uniref:Uncharacterized protein n=2 Tax=Sporothrix schenckii TaxID=29908 RepID=U7PHF0_SPOS1|nr:uncharacterized protein SPSK_00287 [Sporothrix schenckii 1099-18]ERS94937.1 hypothetical protein HMPREF1624_08648 [Sporothrix schenckii ATCC 58251]KJR83964.1 hypothetical protein SPSK_00287 [Sporothrix schenckii 1099-18]